MFRRDFFNAMAGLGAAFGVPAAISRPLQSLSAAPHAATRTTQPIPRTSITLQRCAIAGFQFHQGAQVWSALAIGSPLTLIREPENRFDPLAIRVEWNGQMIGYVPRAENEIAAGLLDRGERLSASIASLAVDQNPWKRIGVEIGVVV